MRRAFVLIALFMFTIVVEAKEVVPAKELQALHYRSIGPSRGGRVAAVAGVPQEPFTFYMGNSGGVWKSRNAGETWENISDAHFKSASIGAIAVSESDPNVVYVGTGQSTIRGNVTLGVGVYKSLDAGRTWSHTGLPKAGQIGRIRVHPQNPDLVYAAVIGNAFVPNEDRGLYRSRDGGKNWERILYISPKTGFADLSMDPNNPRVLYASAWTGQRKPWTIVSGSEECGLYKSTDGGDTWEKLAGGLPQGVVGKIGVAISPAKPERVWAIVEAAENEGLFRSDDAGETWKRFDTNAKRRLYQRAWYYMHIFADPKDAQKVYVLNVDQFVSRDGGLTFEEIDPPHGDGHDMWINPRDPRIMIMGNDGGATVSLDDAKGWSTHYNQPTAEIYYVTVDEGYPYRVYGAQQDNTTISIPSRPLYGLTEFEHWRDVGGCEDGHIAFHPKHPDIVYAGCYGGEITRVNVATGEVRYIMTYPEMEIGLAPRDLRYRFNWNAPIRVSPHDPNIVYHCSQHVHRSTDEGHSWEVISPDLSRNDKTKQDYSGEPITYENTGIEVYSNILTFEESPQTPGLLWAGSDDGLVHISKDNGKNWENITPKQMPDWATVNMIELSPHDAGRAFLAVHKYRMGDQRPYIFLTNDYGKNWKLLTDGRNGIGAETPTRVVREDPAQKGLLYAGTESGMFVSFDDGSNWQSLQLNLPILPITDLRVHRNDLVLATQGRSFWILDDITPLQYLARRVAREDSPLFYQPRDVYRIRTMRTSENPDGIYFYYSLTKEPAELQLEIKDANEKIIQRFYSNKMPDRNPVFPYGFMGRYEADRQLTKKQGLNRFIWDLRDQVIDFPEGTIVWGYLGAPKVAPGNYSATLVVDGKPHTQSFRVLKDPKVAASDADLQEQYAFMARIRDKLDELYHGVRVIRSVRNQVNDVVSRFREAGVDIAELQKSADSLARSLTAIEEELMQPRNEADQDTENYPTKLDNQLAYIYMHLNETDSPPTEGQKERVRDLEAAIDAQFQRLKTTLDKDLAYFNELCRSKGVVIIPAKRP